MTAPPPVTASPTHAMVGDGPAPAPAPAAPDVSVWDTWRAAFRIVDGVVGGIKDLVETRKIPIPDKLFQPVLAGLFGLNAALVDVDTAFYNFVKSGDASAFTLDPPPIVVWPDSTKPTSTTLNLFKDALDVVTGALQLESTKIAASVSTHPEMKIMLAAVNVLINSENDIVATIKAVLDPAPAPVTPPTP